MIESSRQNPLAVAAVYSRSSALVVLIELAAALQQLQEQYVLEYTAVVLMTTR